MSKLKEDWQKEATDLGIALDVDGKEKTIDELSAEIERAEKAATDKGRSEAERFASLAGKGKKVKVEFLSSPTGVLKLGYNVGETASFTAGQADFLADLGFAKKL